VTPNLDDPYWRGGDPLLMIAKTDGILYSFGAATNLEAQFRVAQAGDESGPGNRTSQ
jgi:hypothetical protein